MKCSECKEKKAVGYAKGTKYVKWHCGLCYEKKGKYPDSAHCHGKYIKKLYKMG